MRAKHKSARHFAMHANLTVERVSSQVRQSTILPAVCMKCTFCMREAPNGATICQGCGAVYGDILHWYQLLAYVPAVLAILWMLVNQLLSFGPTFSKVGFWIPVAVLLVSWGVLRLPRIQGWKRGRLRPAGTP